MTLLTDKQSDSAVRRIVAAITKKCGVRPLAVSVYFSVDETSAKVVATSASGRRRWFRATGRNFFKTFRLDRSTRTR